MPTLDKSFYSALERLAVICGMAMVIMYFLLQGLGNNTADYQKLALSLKGYGVLSVVAKVSRIDWLRNAAGLVDPNYWRRTLRPRPVLDWYLKRVDEAVNKAKEMSQGGSLSLIGHTAGGWLARVYMEEFGSSDVSLLLTLGAPHLPPPKDVPGVIDQTRGLLYYVEEKCRKAVYTPELKYVCIAGRAVNELSQAKPSDVQPWLITLIKLFIVIELCFFVSRAGLNQGQEYIQGARLFGNSNIISTSAVPAAIDQSIPEAAIMNDTSTSAPVATTFRARFIGQGYKQVCGQADVWGDGVVRQKYQLTWKVHLTLVWMECTTHLLVRMMTQDLGMDLPLF
ncbi:hypothetical protein RJ639_044797 [Escallonia herrerae]|uniref:GPI inositol-deacylase n=1 Tax=Escallonia herrerae TaxID=1293975 RepID=A0AA88WCA5_9ASTE|nr:hypothetical protein RJ639_044797 [Escallonia herrerae]